MGHNEPPLTKETLTADLREDQYDLVERVEALQKKADIAPGEITSEEMAGKFATLIKDIRSFLSEAEKQRKACKKPYIECGKWVDGWFKGTLTADIMTARGKLNDKLTVYQREKAREARERAEAEARERAREAQEREAEREAAEASTDTSTAAVAAVRAEDAHARADHAADAAKAPASELGRVTASSGPTASLRTDWRCTEWDRDKLDFNAIWGHFSDACIEGAIKSYIRQGGRELAGATIESVETSRVR